MVNVCFIDNSDSKSFLNSSETELNVFAIHKKRCVKQAYIFKDPTMNQYTATAEVEYSSWNKGDVALGNKATKPIIKISFGPYLMLFRIAVYNWRRHIKAIVN